MKKHLTQLSLVTALGLTTLTAQAQTVDGTRDASYPAALAVQTVDTQFGDHTGTSSQSFANGSEIDNIHAQIVGSTLYLFVGGNLESNFNKLDLFFDSKSGGQPVLTGNGQYVGNMNGLTFDTGFAADYALSVTCGNNPLEVYANYAPLPTGSITSDFIGGGTGRTQNVNFGNVVSGNGTGTISIDNSNIAGVGGGNGAANTANATAVATGVEYAIPLSALGTTANGGDIKIVAFINNGGWNFLSNQVLGGLPTGTSNLGGPGGVNFANQAGSQFVTVANGTVATTAPAISTNPTALSFANVAAGSSATRTFDITNTGTASLSVTSITSSNGTFTVSPTTATVAAGASTTVTVTFAPTAGGSQSGTLTIASNDPATPSTTLSISGMGVAAGQVVVDGTVDAALYGAAKVLQTTPTGFGDNNSELDGAYARVDGTDLYVTLTGNLENNSNKLVLFFDASPTTGQNTFLATNPTTDNSGALAGLRFDRGFLPESFVAINLGGTSLYASYVPMNGGGGFGTYLSTNGNGLTQTLSFSASQTGELSLNNSNTGGVTGSTVGTPGAVQTGIELRIPLSVLGAGIGSTTPIHVMALITNGDYNYLSNQTLGGLPNGTGNLGLNGAGGGTLPNSVDFLNYAGNQFFTAQRGNVTIADTRDIAGEYNTITVAPTGVASVYSPLNVSTALQVGGAVIFQPLPDAIVSGTGTTTVLGAVAISSTAGITASGATGNVQTAGRSFGTSAQYAYINLTPGVTGSGLPATVGALGVGATGNLTLSQPVSISQGLALSSSGSLLTNGQALTLLSSATGTALVVNSGSGTVQGTATVQRYISNQNGSLGYHHYSAPVSNTTLADLATPGFSPVLNTAYNSSATPGTVSPFPNVFAYNESRVNTITSDYSAFDKGWEVPTTAAMTVGQGYTVNIASTEKVDFMGTLNNGDVTRSLPRTGGTDGGWHLVGNPYPAPLDYALVAAGDRSNLDAAMYVFESNGPYTGSYRTYLPGFSTSGNVLASSQGFFVRTSTPGVTGTLTFRNSQRVTSATTAAPFYRNTTDTRPQVQLTLAGAGRPTDRMAVYGDAQATTGLDTQYDAVKLPNPSGLNLAAQAAGTELAINGLPTLAPGLVVPLAVRVPSAGTYTLHTEALRNLSAGLPVYLRDAATGQQTDLRQTADYTFSLNTAQAAALGTGRFSLVFSAAGALANQAALQANSISFYPNPAHGTAILLVPAVAGASKLEVGLYNALGQLVRPYPVAALPAAGLRTMLDLNGVAAGLYTLRLTAGETTISKKVAVE